MADISQMMELHYATNSGKLHHRKNRDCFNKAFVTQVAHQYPYPYFPPKNYKITYPLAHSTSQNSCDDVVDKGTMYCNLRSC